MLEVSGMSCVVRVCVNADGEYILYDGTNYSTSTDEEVSPYTLDLIEVTYEGQGYTFELGDNVLVVPPVDVPTWIGVYPD